jgi:uncharacterized protein YjbI with pentapeptide repeats
MTRANLTEVDMSQIDLTGGNLVDTTLKNAQLEGAVLRGVVFGWTIFADTDLSEVTGLETGKHLGPSSLGLDTFFKSRGRIPEDFLRAAGIPNDFPNTPLHWRANLSTSTPVSSATRLRTSYSFSGSTSISKQAGFGAGFFQKMQNGAARSGARSTRESAFTTS